MAERHPVFAFFYPGFVWFSERIGFGRRRHALLADAYGKVVEVGVGTGANFHHYPPGVVVVGSDPEPGMIRRARKTARRAGANYTLYRGIAEELPFEDESVDTVVSTLVLCSVPDQATALAELRRVLRPGGKLLVLEHVRSDDPKLAARQDRKEPRQVRRAGGCHPNRDTLAAIVEAGFEVGSVERFHLPGTKITSPGIQGIARKPS